MSTNAELFKDKRVLISGGSKGIGALITTAFLSAGAKVTILSRNPDNISTLKGTLSPTLSSNLSFIAVDVTSWDDTTTLLSPHTFDILVNNVGIRIHEPFLEVTPSALDQVFATNLKSLFAVSQIVAKNMIKDGVKNGVILNMSSLASTRVFPKAATYSVSKAGIDMLTKVMAVELGPFGIRVNSVNPSGVLTDEMKEKLRFAANQTRSEDEASQAKETFDIYKIRTPFEGSCGGGPVVSMEEVVSTVMFLCSEQSSGTTGQNIFVDNGYLAG